jgi:hypothetical protein
MRCLDIDFGTEMARSRLFANVNAELGKNEVMLTISLA